MWIPWRSNFIITSLYAVYRVFVGRLRERYHLKGLGVDGRTILKWVFKKWDEEAWTWLIWLGMGTRWRVLVIAARNVRVPSNARNFLTSWGPGSFWGRNLLRGVSSSVYTQGRREVKQIGSDARSNPIYRTSCTCATKPTATWRF
jgi:hypothetical protein